MSDPQPVDQLNALLAAEYAGLLPRLREADPYISWPAAADRLLIEKLLADVAAHEHELIVLIYKLRGAPISRRYDAKTASLHYLRFDYLMPEILQSLRELIRAYESVGPTGHAEADALVARHLEGCKRHLQALGPKHGRQAASF